MTGGYQIRSILRHSISIVPVRYIKAVNKIEAKMPSGKSCDDCHYKLCPLTDLHIVGTLGQDGTFGDIVLGHLTGRTGTQPYRGVPLSRLSRSQISSRPSITSPQTS